MKKVSDKSCRIQRGTSVGDLEFDLDLRSKVNFKIFNENTHFLLRQSKEQKVLRQKVHGHLWVKLIYKESIQSKNVFFLVFVGKTEFSDDLSSKT